MYQLDYDNPSHLYFIGIGGVSMSGFAELLHSFGFRIRGSDSTKSATTSHLESLGIQVLYGQDAANITDDVDLVVYTAAIAPDNPEFMAAKALNLPMMPRATMVGQVMRNYQEAIAVAGTHGKTTTTSMTANVFIEADADPTVAVGGDFKGMGGNLRIGKSDFFIMEACEYTNSFLQFYPTVAIILNVEAEHLDFFKDVRDVRRSFHAFAKRVPPHGLVIINAEIEDYEDLVADLDCDVVTYGVEKGDADYSASHIEYDDGGCARFDLLTRGEFVSHIHLGVPGVHNVSNALATFAAAHRYHLDAHKVEGGLASFRGTSRRFEVKGKRNGVTVIDDYAHHPTEIAVTLEAAKRLPHRELWCVFQPHTYSRTRALSGEMAKALSLADKVVLTDVYAAREKDPGDVSSELIREKLLDLGCDCYFIKSFDEIENFLINNCIDGDLLITMGAGNVVTIGERLISG